MDRFEKVKKLSGEKQIMKSMKESTQPVSNIQNKNFSKHYTILFGNLDIKLTCFFSVALILCSFL